MSLIKFKQEVTDVNLEEAMILLSDFGEPRISKMDNGWYAVVEMFVPSKGVSFKIDTAFDQKTPSSAINSLVGRVKNTLVDLDRKVTNKSLLKSTL